MNKKLEIGTTVEVTGNISFHGFKTGDIVRLSEIRKSGSHEFTNGKQQWYMMDDDYTIVEELSIGDKVQVIYNDSDHRFKIGEIVKFKGHGMFEYLDGRDWWIMSPHEYKMVDTKDNIGSTYVVVYNPDKLHYFEVGEIVTRTDDIASSTGSYRYDNKDGIGQYLTKDDVKLIYEEKISTPNAYASYTVSSSAVSRFITIGNVTIAIPKDCPIGISSKHPDDEYSSEIGQAVAQYRLLENADELDVDVCW